MKKLMMVAGAMAVCASMAFAGEPVYKSGSISIPLDTKVVTSAVVRVVNTGVGREDFNLVYRVDAVNDNIGATGTVSFVTVDNGVFQTFATSEKIEGVGNNIVLMTNDLTTARMWPVRDIKVIVTQDETNAVVGTWHWGIFVK